MCIIIHDKIPLLKPISCASGEQDKSSHAFQPCILLYIIQEAIPSTRTPVGGVHTKCC